MHAYYKVKKIEDLAYHTSLKMLFTATPCLLFTEPLSHTITLPLASVLGVISSKTNTRRYLGSLALSSHLILLILLISLVFFSFYIIYGPHGAQITKIKADTLKPSTSMPLCKNPIQKVFYCLTRKRYKM